MAKKKKQDIQEKEITKGVLILAFGDNSYGKWAYNLAYSLRHYNRDLNIHLAYQNEAVKGIDLSVFSTTQEEYFPSGYDGKLDVAAIKMQLHDYSPYDQTIYLDADGICLNDITPLFDVFEKEHVWTQIISSGKITDAINYMWVDNKPALWDHFELTDKTVWPASQTSIILFDKSEFAMSFFDKLRENYANKVDPSLFSQHWGPRKLQPDELYYSGTLAQLDMVPDMTLQPVFFPDKPTGNIPEIKANHQIMAMHGARNVVKVWAKDYYNRLMHKYLTDIGLNHIFKSHKLYEKKFSG